MPLITSLQNPRIKDVVRLRDRRGRSRQGRIVIDGARELWRAIEAGVELVELFWCAELAVGAEARAVCERFDGREGTAPTVWQVTPTVFEKLAFGDRADGVVGVARVAPRTLDDLALPDQPLVVVVEGVEKPGNLGAILRSADGAGVSAVIFCEEGTDCYNPNVIRASLGTVFTLPVCSATATEARDWLRRRGFRMYAARVEGAARYWEVSWRGAVALILGAEATGLSDVWQGDDIVPVALPMLGAADSLNVSATAAVLCYEALRQRQSP